MRSSGARTPSSAAGFGCLALFGLPFATIGTTMAGVTLYTLFRIMLMQGWPTVPATLKTVDLESASSSRGTEMAKATYSYSFNGQQFTGSRVSLYGADNLGSFHKDSYEKLHDYLVRNEPYPLHVNPNAPDQSILLPVLRWNAIGFYLLFTIVFGGIGWGLILTTIFGILKMRKERVLIQQFPDEPWKQRVEWSGSRINSSQGMQATIQICLAVLWNVASFPVWIVVPQAVADGQYFALTFLIIPLIGLGLIYWAAVTVSRARRFGKTYLHLDTMPVRPGGEVRGQIFAPKALENASSVNLQLRCERTTRVRGGNNGTYYKSVDAWHTKTTTSVVRGQSAEGEVMLPVALRVSGEFPGTSLDSSAPGADQYRWYLAASAPLEGADFAAEFEIPVFEK